MPLPAPQTQEFTEQLALMQGQTRQELEQSQQQLQEIRLLLNQTTGEVEKLMQRELALANRVREDWLLEHVLKEEFSPRQELADKDGGALEVGIAGIVREAAQNAQQAQPAASHNERG